MKAGTSGFLKGAVDYKNWLFVCFLLGILGGTAAACFCAGSREGALGLEEASLWSLGMVQASPGAFARVCRLRLGQMAAGWMAGMTVCSFWLFGLFSLYTGMCLSAALAVMTLEEGLLGLPVFLSAALPHGLCYGLVWAVLAMWAGNREKRMHLLPLILLAGIAVAGAFLEIYVSPLLLNLWI